MTTSDTGICATNPGRGDQQRMGYENADVGNYQEAVRHDSQGAVTKASATITR